MRMDAESRRARWLRRFAGGLLCCFFALPAGRGLTAPGDPPEPERPKAAREAPPAARGAEDVARAKTEARARPKPKAQPKGRSGLGGARRALASPGDKGLGATADKSGAPATNVSAHGSDTGASESNPTDGGASTTLVKKVSKGNKRLKPWRGSQFVFSNAFSAISLAPGAELTYNPTYYMTFSFRPRWWFDKMFYVRAELSVVRELTENDSTTYANEAWLGDLSLVGGASKLYVIPKAKIAISADLALTFPTSKASQAATLVMGIGPNVRISRAFKVLKGLSFGGSMRVTPYIYRYTTRQRKSPLVTHCAPSESNCDAFMNMGGRNPKVRMSLSLDASLQIIKWLGVSLSYGWMIDWLHPASGGEDIVSYVPQEPQDERYFSFFGLSVIFDPIKQLQVALNYQTYAPQLAPDSTYYNPIYNRYTTFSLDLILRVDGFIALFGGK